MKVECKGLDQIRVYLFLFCLTVPLLTDVLGLVLGNFYIDVSIRSFQSLSYF